MFHALCRIDGGAGPEIPDGTTPPRPGVVANVKGLSLGFLVCLIECSRLSMPVGLTPTHDDTPGAHTIFGGFLKTPRLKFYGIELPLDQLTQFLSIVGGPRPSYTGRGWCGLYDRWREDLKRPFRRRDTTPTDAEEFISRGLMVYEKQDPVSHYYVYTLTELGFNYISRVVHANRHICKWRTNGFIRRQRKREKARIRKAALARAEHPAPSV